MLVKVLLFIELLTRFNAAWSRLIRKVEEVDVGLHEAFTEQMDTHIHLVFALF